MLAGLAGCGAAPVATDTDASAPVQEAPVEEQTPATQAPAEEDSAAQTPAEAPAQAPAEEAVSLADLPRDDDVTTLQDSAAALTAISEAFSTSLDNGDFGSMEDVSTFFQTQASASLPNSTVEMDETHLTISFRLDGIERRIRMLHNDLLLGVCSDSHDGCKYYQKQPFHFPDGLSVYRQSLSNGLEQHYGCGSRDIQ